MTTQFFYSTRGTAPKADLAHALFRSLAPDGGLYMPANIPDLGTQFWDQIDALSFQEIAFELTNALIGQFLPSDALRKICNQAFDFEVPVTWLEDDVYVLELFHGPSLAFKDFGARFMSRIMSNLLQSGTDLSEVLGKVDQTESGTGPMVDVLVATSGDTGGAVAMGFLGTPGIRVTILYPKGKVSHLQELQLTTLGQNVRAIEVDGTFDDCQALVKQAFNDSTLRGKLWLTSANSINLFRLIPQSLYYAWAYAQLKGKLKQDRLTISVPSGNFGNLCAGLLIQRMGCPITQFVASTNVNNVVPRYLSTGLYDPQPTIPTISNAMDVGSPSNWERIAHLFKNDYGQIRKLITGFDFSDEVTTLAMSQIFALRHYILEPHAAVAYLGLKTYLKQNLPSTGVLLATAHPAKFTDVMPAEVAKAVEVPERLAVLRGRPKVAIPISNDYAALKQILLT